MRLSHTADSLSFAITVADWQALTARARYGVRLAYLDLILISEMYSAPDSLERTPP